MLFLNIYKIILTSYMASLPSFFNKRKYFKVNCMNTRNIGQPKRCLKHQNNYDRPFLKKWCFSPLTILKKTEATTEDLFKKKTLKNFAN